MTEPVRLGVVMLCHGDLDLAARLARIWAGGGARVCVHIDRNTEATEADGMIRALAEVPGVIFAPRRRCEWGRFSLVQATLDAVQHFLRTEPDLTHVYLVSGRCLPLRPVSELVAHLAADPGRDHIESVNALEMGWTRRGLNEERFSLYFPFSWRRQRWLFDRAVAWQRRSGLKRRLPGGLIPHLGSQWWCLTTRTLRAILQDPERRHIDRFFRLCWIPDESYFQTMVRRHSDRVASLSLTLSRFDHEGRPFQLYDDHAAMLEDSQCFVARKVWPGASGLLSTFPRPGRTSQAVPHPERFEQVMNRAAQRRVRGRAGLYMQSRFPRRDAENGKTTAPYAVFQGFNAVFPGFEDWLGARLYADVHGHLLGPALVEFAGRPEVGPGCLSANPALRDRDPRSFLTSLIRITPRMQAFQFSPRDNQALNWFMATDPNAHLFVVTGAWMLPLLRSNLPFDDLRRLAARMRRTELEQLDILNSVWVKARVQIHDLDTALARPRDVLDLALRQLDPLAEPLTGLPVMRDLSGLSQALCRLRDSGLQLGVSPEILAERRAVENPVAEMLRTAAE